MNTLGLTYLNKYYKKDIDVLLQVNGFEVIDTDIVNAAPVNYFRALQKNDDVNYFIKPYTKYTKLMEKYPQIRVFCILPFEEQAAKWTPELQERYFVILEKSTSNHLISTRPTRDFRTRCNRYLVDHVGFIVAVYENGRVALLEPAAHLITYARKKRTGNHHD